MTTLTVPIITDSANSLHRTFRLPTRHRTVDVGSSEQLVAHLESLDGIAQVHLDDATCDVWLADTTNWDNFLRPLILVGLRQLFGWRSPLTPDELAA